MGLNAVEHPGKILKRDFMAGRNITGRSLAEGICVSPKTISRLTSGSADISLDMAMRLAKAFNTEASFWLDLQLKYSLQDEIEIRDKLRVREFWKEFENFHLSKEVV